jgi:RNA polymerase sigma-70 factor, ECF subfamily
MGCLRENRELLRRFKAGSEEAFRVVYLNYINDIELFVSTGWFDPNTRTHTAGLKNMELRAELIQEVFLKAFSEKARSAYDGIRSYKTYLRTIAKNVIIDYVRKRSKDAISHICLELDNADTANDRLDIGELSVESDISEEMLHWNRCVDSTAEYVKTLDDTQKRFVALRFQEELSLLEAARRLNLTRGRARWLEKQLAHRLKDHLAEQNLLKQK